MGLIVMKPSIPKGTRDFGPVEMAKRNYIFNTIRAVYELYGFQQIETPAQETLQTLMGKYGEEGDKLLFKILNSGDFLSKLSDDDLRVHPCPSVPNQNESELNSVPPCPSVPKNPAALAAKICEKGLRYDLTVPFARYVVMHRDELQLPFKRYQVQPVWRADRPQKGRYREFYQFDGDVVGSDSLLNEVELMQIVDEVFRRLGVRVEIKINNRKILTGIAEVIGAADKIVDITVAIDKLDKIGIDNVNAELREKGLSDEAIATLQPLLALDGTNEERLTALAGMLAGSEVGMKGIEEMRYVLDHVVALGTRARVELDVSLARGLNYYTGTILEVKALDVAIGSITGGGRYDNLTGVFGMPGLSGVGISFGADRIYDVLNALDLYPADTMATARVMFVNFGEQEAAASLGHIMALRRAGISAELYPDISKMKKQMNYANDRQIPYVAIVGADEVQNGTIALKNMVTGEQQSLTVDQVIEKLGK